MEENEPQGKGEEDKNFFSPLFILLSVTTQLVILSVERHERSRRIHDVTIFANLRSNFNALDSSTSFVPLYAQNDKLSSYLILQPSSFPLFPDEIE